MVIIMEGNTKEVVLTFVGVDFWLMPVYRVNNQDLFVKDMSMGKGPVELHWSSPKDDPDGEPDGPFVLKEGVKLTIEKPQERSSTREEKKFIIAKMIAANEYVDGKNSLEWLDLASGIKDIELTKELLEELKRDPQSMQVVWTPEHGYTRVQQNDTEPHEQEFDVAVTWMMSGTYHIRASSIEDAILKVQELPLPDNGEYIQDSFQVDEDAFRSAYGGDIQ